MSGQVDARPSPGAGHGVRVALTPRKIALAVVVALVLAAAAFVRFTGLEHGRIDGDQSVTLGIAMRFVRGGPLPLVANKSSAGIMNPPLIEYLLALPLLLRQEIVWAAAFGALLGFLAVALCCLIVSGLVGWRAGLIAALLFAASPWAVHYSRFIWNPNLVPCFSTALLGLLLLYLARQPRPIYLVLALVCLAAVIQLHLAALVLIPIVGLILLLFRRSVSPKWLLVGAALFALSFLPYLVFVFRTGFVEVRAMLSALGGQQAHVNLAPFLLIRDLATGNGLVESGPPEWRTAVWPWSGLARLEGWLLVAGLAYGVGYLLLRGWRELSGRRPAPRAAILAILLLWIVVPGLLYVRHTVYLQNYYFIYLYPAPFILIGLAVDQALQALKAAASGPHGRWLRWACYPAAVLLVGSVVAIGAWQFQVAQARIALEEQGVLGGRQVGDVDRLIAAVRRLSVSHPGASLVVISEGHSADTSPFGLLTDASPMAVRYAEDGRGFIIPPGDALYLDTTGSGWAQAWLDEGLQELAQDRIQAARDTWRFFYKAAGVSPYPQKDARVLARWTNGAELWDCHVAGELRPGGTAVVTQVWRATQPPGPRLYHFFNHLAAEADGRLVAQADGPGVDTTYWRAGEVFITRWQIAIPPDAPAGRYRLRLGIYGWPDLKRVPLAGGQDALDVSEVELAGP